MSASLDALKAQYESYTAEVERLQREMETVARSRREALSEHVRISREYGQKPHYSDYGLAKQTFSALLKKAREESRGD